MPKKAKSLKTGKPGSSDSTEPPPTAARGKRHGSNVRLSNHKARGRWFQARSAWPVREAPVHTLIRERERTAKSLPPVTTLDSSWECVGPTNIGGRITSLVCHPDHPERIWAGSAGGGVWRSNDAGQTWQSCWSDQDILNIGSLGIDQKNPDLIYCGTGEANLSSDSYPGVGLYKSSDEGKTWQLIASSEKQIVPKRIGAIAVDPFDSKHVLLGGVGLAEVSSSGKDMGGLYVSTNAGINWKRMTFVSSRNYWCHAVVFHPKTRGRIYATFTEQGSRSGIWRSTDGGKKWEHLKKGLPEAARFGRTSLAISPSNPDVLYAFAKNEASGDKDLLLGVFRSTNGGDTWKSIHGAHFKDEGQISYGNTIVVHPTNPDYVICGGVDLHRTTDAGATWKKITRWDANVGTPVYAHADHHALIMPPKAVGRVYDPNDGGLDVSEDGGNTWTNRSKGLAVTMFYDMDVAQTDSKVFGGGAQDNGTVATTTGFANGFFPIDTGDGGWNIFDPADAGHVFTSAYNLLIQRYHGLNKAPVDVSPHASIDEQNSVWMCYIAMDPADSNTLFTGSTRVWRTRNDGDSWQHVSTDLDSSAISAIEIASTNSKRIYVGTENGGLFRSSDGGDTWSANISSSILPGHTITRIESHPKDANLLYVAAANFGHAHVFRSKDGGETWEDVDQGQLPDVPHHVVMIPPDDLNKVYAGNDAGVFVLDTRTGAWSNLTRNLPNAMVIDLVYHLKEATLFAATYGRSIWRLRMK
ncbi:MAG: WD40/YVTN/BNR-like repeat-containing protein [Pyrinomonadaceae bacterium]